MNKLVIREYRAGCPLCLCGCGKAVSVPTHNDTSKGWIKGKPLGWVRGHRARSQFGPDYVVDPDTGCWVWIKARKETGYGTVGTPTKRTGAHRLYYERYVGPIPDGLEIDHLCRNRACVNPAHLEPVTHRENCRRARARMGPSPEVQVIVEVIERGISA